MKQGVTQLWIVNRTQAKAEELATVCQGRWLMWEQAVKHLVDVDIAIVCTQAPHYVVDAGDLEVLWAAEAPGGLLHPLDDRIDCLKTGIGDPLAQVGEHVGQMAADQLGHLGHRLEPTVGGPPEPAGEERLGGPEGAVLPELPDALLEGSRPARP
jgi:hypothetical protein